MSTFPIERTPNDILLVIFQVIIDEEAALIQPLLSRVPKPREAASISLVCQSWKNLVYRTASLWTTIVLDMTDSEERVQAYCNRLGAFSKKAPVDLYVLRLHDPGRKWEGSPQNCCSRCPCRGSEVALSLNAIQSIRKLYISTINVQSFCAFEPSLSRIDKVTDTTIAFYWYLHLRRAWETPPGRAIDDQFLSRMKSLNRLHIGEVKSLSLPVVGGHPLLPTVRTLELESRQYHSYPISLFVNIISHCPNLEFLDYDLAELGVLDTYCAPIHHIKPLENR